MDLTWFRVVEGLDLALFGVVEAGPGKKSEKQKDIT